MKLFYIISIDKTKLIHYNLFYLTCIYFMIILNSYTKTYMTNIVTTNLKTEIFPDTYNYPESMTLSLLIHLLTPL